MPISANPHVKEDGDRQSLIEKKVKERESDKMEIGEERNRETRQKQREIEEQIINTYL